MNFNKIKNINIDILYLFFLILILMFLYLKYGNNIYIITGDFGREAYISSEVANGKVLYKDIFNIFAPMAYLVNALIIKIFNNSINTFLIISFILTTIVLSALYKISTLFIAKSTSFLSCVTIIVTCVFAPTVFNWHLPYSYSYFYALASIMWAFYFTLKYLENSNNRKYILYFLTLYSFSISCKYDFVLYIIVIFLVFIHKKHAPKNYFKAIGIISIFPFISLIILLLQKCTFNDIYFAINYIYKYSTSSIMHFFYQYAGLAPGHFIIEKIKSVRFENLYSMIGYINIIILLFYFIKRYEFKYIIFSLACIILAVKSILYIDVFDWYGPFFFHFLFLNFVVFITKIVNKNFIINIFLLCLIIINIHFGFTINSREGFETVTTNKGSLKIPSFNYSGIKLLDFVNKETNSDDKILVLPEGVIINYLTDRQTNGYLFHLISPNYYALGEDFIIKKFLDANFNYVIFQDYNYIEYGNEIFIDDWGKNFYNLVLDKYEFHKEFINENGISFIVYKVKEQN
ncbi:glycosyltransferase family 39 protein [bacterium]|nr:glycosyltransferase family 39 protein [bacterium]